MTALPGPRNVNVVSEIDEAVIASLNEAVMIATPVAPLAGWVAPRRTAGWR